jgi:hypothetical protein
MTCDESPVRSNTIVKPNYKGNIKINTHRSNDFKATYGAIFTAKNSVIDPLVNQQYEKYKKEQMVHHKINLLSPNYREIYDRSSPDGVEPPQYNSKVPLKSSVKDKDYQYFDQKMERMNN